MLKKNYEISLVIPVFNEQEVLREAFRRIESSLQSLNFAYEIIFVNDGSVDGTAEILEELRSAESHVKVIHFSRNFGHQSAITAGLHYALGKAVITIDADLQHPPELIPTLIEKWKEGYEVVYTVRDYGESEGMFKKITSSLFYRLINLLTHTEIPTYAADFKLYDEKVVKSLNTLKERTRFLRGLTAWVGFRQVPVHYRAAQRAAGKSKYTPAKMFKFALDGITSFSIIPLKISIYFGFVVSFLSFIYLSYVFYMAIFTEETVAGWASTTASLLFIGGVQLVAIGILGEYVGRIYEEIKQRPPYIISRASGFEDESQLDISDLDSPRHQAQNSKIKNSR